MRCILRQSAGGHYGSRLPLDHALFIPTGAQEHSRKSASRPALHARSMAQNPQRLAAGRGGSVRSVLSTKTNWNP